MIMSAQMFTGNLSKILNFCQSNEIVSEQLLLWTYRPFFLDGPNIQPDTMQHIQIIAHTKNRTRKKSHFGITLILKQMKPNLKQYSPLSLILKIKHIYISGMACLVSYTYINFGFLEEILVMQHNQLLECTCTLVYMHSSNNTYAHLQKLILIYVLKEMIQALEA